MMKKTVFAFSSQFTGSFYGIGHVLSNFTYTTGEGSDYIALFGRPLGTTIIGVDILTIFNQSC
jgi:hypothetical protein